MDSIADVALFSGPAHADSKKEGIDVQDIVFSHIQDAYTWHITEWNGKEIAISLPILVKSEERGWDMFLSHHYITAKRITTIISLQKRTRRQGGGKEQPRRRGAPGRLVADQECLRPVPELRHPAVRSSTDRPLVQETSEPGSERVYRPDGNDYFYIQDGVIKESIGKEEYRRFPLIC